VRGEFLAVHGVASRRNAWRNAQQSANGRRHLHAGGLRSRPRQSARPGSGLVTFL